MSEFENIERVTIEFEELGLAVAQTLKAQAGFPNDVHHSWREDDVGLIAHQFRSYIAAGAPRRVTVSAKAPRTWYWHLIRDIAQNAATKSATSWATVFGYWLASKVQHETIYAHEEVNRNVCPHIRKPGGDRSHYEFLMRKT